MRMPHLPSFDARAIFSMRGFFVIPVAADA